VHEVRRRFENSVFNTIVHRNVRLGESQSFRQPVVLHDATSSGAVNYLNLAREVLQNNGLTKMDEEDKILDLTKNEQT
jgi:chromosome partitioning protein